MLLSSECFAYTGCASCRELYWPGSPAGIADFYDPAGIAALQLCIRLVQCDSAV